MDTKFILHILFIFTLILSGCTQGGADNTKPMYGEIEKSEGQKEADKEFIEDCLEEFGTIDSSIKVTNNNGWSYLSKNDKTTAIKRFNQSWMLNPEHPEAYFGFAFLEDLAGNKNESERFYALALTKDKQFNIAEGCYNRIAQCSEALGLVEKTIESYERMAHINPNSSIAYKKLGYFYSKIEKKEKSLSAYLKAIELDPNDEITYGNLGYLYYQMGKYDKAIENYNHALSLNAKYIYAYVNRGILEMDKGQYKLAKKDFELSVELDKSEGGLWRLLALSKQSLGDKKGACNDLLRAKELGDKVAPQLIQENCQ